MPDNSTFEDLVQSGKTLLLDGGLSNELEVLGMDLNNSLWSASVLKDHPDKIIEAHLNYLDAGADIIISSSYQASEMGFKDVGVESEEARALIAKSVTLAKRARERFAQYSAKHPLIAASIGPYGAAMADGSEYTGDYGISDDELRAFHEDRLMLLDESGADLLACETIPSLQEAEVLHGLLLKVKSKAWISFSCRDGAHANDGTPIEELGKLFENHPNVIAVGINCTAPQHAEELIRRLKKTLPNKAIVAYPNSGENYDAETKSWQGTYTPISCGLAARSWLDAGATIVGGCCRMGPAHIEAMKDTAQI